MPDHQKQRSEAQRDTNAAELQPDLQDDIMWVRRQDLARKCNPSWLLSGIAVADNSGRSTTGEARGRIESPADHRALLDLWLASQQLTLELSGPGNSSGKITAPKPNNPSPAQRI